MPAAVEPLSYLINLTLAPGSDIFSGAIDLKVRFNQPSTTVWLNAENLTVTGATLIVGEQTLIANATIQPQGFIRFLFEHRIPSGAATLHIQYYGQIRREEAHGIFQVKNGENWYVYSQFESVAARQAFPCFDEPRYKVPWQLTLNVPKGDSAFSNTPVVSETEHPNGIKTVQFAETKPLSSYLVALAVGPMEAVEAGRAGVKHTPVRIIVPRGHADETRFAAATTLEMLERLEEYFGIPYPYDKLDEVAIPRASFAMEHPGLITYGSGLFLMKSEGATLRMKRFATSLVAHELAHQWFGNLVTTFWWDDIWLNEGFASWMANKIVNEYRPEWQMSISVMNRTQDAMRADELASSRKVRQPIISLDDLANAFDGITYDKGSALMDMFESYMGAHKFKKAIRRYLRRYAWGNATSADFLESISHEEPAISHAFSTFLDQPGVPLVKVRLECNGKAAKVDLYQQRFLPLGSKASADEVWDIPICIRYPTSQGSRRVCTLMTRKHEVVALNKKVGCPAWVDANDHEVGYYRVLYQRGMLNSLIENQRSLTPVERVGIVGNVAALTQGSIALGEALVMVKQFANDPNREVLTKTIEIVSDLEDHFVSEDLKPRYRQYISDLYKRRAERLGWRKRPGDDEDTRLLRAILFRAVANQAQDGEFIERARTLALAWLDDHSSVDPDMARVILSTAARFGDRALFERFLAQLAREKDENIRGNLFKALGSFRDPDILKKALSIVLTDQFERPELLAIVFGAVGVPETRDIVYNFMKMNWDLLMNNLPIDSEHLLPLAVGDYCDTRDAADIQAFFKDRVEHHAGEPRSIAQVIERINLCVANKNMNEASVLEFLKK